MRSLSIFYILVVYVFLQFCWWAYLLVSQNQEIHDFKRGVARNPDTEILLERELHKKWLMIGGEGAVFLFLLGLGVLKTRAAFKKEMMLNRQQRNFLLSVTHEFKSPLAAIRLYIQTLQKHDLPKEKRELFFMNALEDTERLNKLVENALFASQMESSTFSFNKRRIELSALIDDILSRHPAKERMQLNICRNLQINADPLAITSLISNLIENACKYSEKDTPIGISLTSQKNRVLLQVSDEGIGIKEEERSRIFEKFYRIGNEDTRNTKGTGLGLFIVKHIAEAHEGKVCVKNNFPKGSIFEVSFPKLSNEG